MSVATGSDQAGAAALEAGTLFAVEGMSCSGCARHVTDAIQAVTGVASAAVSLEERRAWVRWRPGQSADPAAVVAAVKAAGFAAQPLESEPPASPWEAWSPLAGWRVNVVLGGTLTAALMLGDWVFGLGMSRWFRWVSLGLALPVQVVCGARFYRGAWNLLKIGGSNMDTLVALGSTTAFVYSLWALLSGWPGHLYFMEAAAIITLVSVGHWLEAKAGERAASSLHALLNLAPATARRWQTGGGETLVPVASLAAGERVWVKPGDRIPLDGEVVEGEAAVDEALLTGEALPVEKSTGAKVYAGTTNRDGTLLVQITAVGEATALANVIAVVQRAQNSRAAIQRLGDQVSSVFVPVVVTVAILAGLWWGLGYTHAVALNQALARFLWPVTVPVQPLAAAVIHAAAVLIVACPCAMGLATPVAVMAGANVAARRGILIRDAQAIEKTGRVTAVVFDKTGTLTRGTITVAALEDLRPQADRRSSLPALAAALAAHSQHPLSRAVAALDSRRGVLGGTVEAPMLTDWREIRGCGVQARSESGWLRLGSLKWLRENGVELEPASRFAADWMSGGATVLGLAVDRHLIGALALRDALKAHAAEVVARVARRGATVHLVTGDNRQTAEAIAAQCGIPLGNVVAEVLPERKAAIVEELRSSGRCVAFVGDGINDAPALAQADLGIAVSQASDVAREAADIILLRSDIEAIPEAIGLAQATLRTIKQNLFWAFFYNAAAVPLAAMGFISPVVCAAAMGFSDLLVIGNALRLRHWRDRQVPSRTEPSGKEEPR